MCSISRFSPPLSSSLSRLLPSLLLLFCMVAHSPVLAESRMHQHSNNGASSTSDSGTNDEASHVILSISFEGMGRILSGCRTICDARIKVQVLCPNLQLFNGGPAITYGRRYVNGFKLAANVPNVH
jgi:hypothetical protein